MTRSLTDVAKIAKKNIRFQIFFRTENNQKCRFTIKISIAVQMNLLVHKVEI